MGTTPESKYTKSRMIIHPINGNQFSNLKKIKRIKRGLKYTIRPSIKPSVDNQPKHKYVGPNMTSSHTKGKVNNNCFDVDSDDTNSDKPSERHVNVDKPDA